MLISVMFIGQIIIDVTNIKNSYPQQVKVLLGPKNPKKKLYIFQFPSVLHRFTSHGPSIYIDWSYATTSIAVPFSSLPGPPLAMIGKMMR